MTRFLAACGQAKLAFPKVSYSPSTTRCRSLIRYDLGLLLQARVTFPFMLHAFQLHIKTHSGWVGGGGHPYPEGTF